MTINTTGIPLNVTKDPQCRHSEHQGFLTYTVTTSGQVMTAAVACSNCGSETSAAGVIQRFTETELREAARNALMRIEAPPLAS